MILNLLNKLFGEASEKTLKKLQPTVAKIKQIAEEYKKNLSDADFPKKTQEFKNRLKQGGTLDQILPEAFALVKDACRRLVGKTWLVRGREFTWDIESPFDVQILGGIVLHQGKIAEMKTGEGKTLVCTMPLYLNALEEKSAWLVTVNEYLAHRDAEWMGGLYHFLGLTVGVIEHDQSIEEKRAAYEADITYGTNNEFGFDYLRDNMSTSLNYLVQRELNYAIIDEVDSILIDEARTPLIISAPAEESTSKYKKYAQLVQHLEENKDYNIDEKLKTATLTEEGIAKMEKLLGVENIYTETGFEEVHHIEQSLKAEANYKCDVDYVVKDGEVIIVDEFTGRLMQGRRYSHGLHQAIEAKENVEIKRESRTLATVTFQNYFPLLKKLAGMTGTAATEAEEFFKIYGLDVVVIPTNKTCIRKDKADVIYKNQTGKFLAIVEKVKEYHKKGQPVLIGTISIEKSEILSRLLTLHGIPHKVLNAKHHEKEAEIIAKAGELAAVTIATNMAGRGTDIKLGLGVKELAGLVMIGSERHESRRIDNQLRGRSGRQGDAGESQFFVSLEDDLMRLFGSERVQNVMEKLGIPETQAIENKLISHSIESAQKKVEGHNFDIRKHLKEYDDVLNKQREIIYVRRRKILQSENMKNDILLLMEKEAEKIVLIHTADRHKNEWDLKEIFETVNAIHRDPAEPIALETLEKNDTQEKLIESIKHYLWKEYEQREKTVKEVLPSELAEKALREMERNLYLRIIDTLWMEHIDAMSQLRQNVALLGYGQRDPLIEYQSQGYQMFKELLATVQSNTVNTLFKVNISYTERNKRREVEKGDGLNTNEEDIEGTTNFENGHTSSRMFIGNELDSKDKQPNIVKVYSNKQSYTIAKKAGRNEPCPCGSGKKYKKCCGV